MRDPWVQLHQYYRIAFYLSSWIAGQRHHFQEINGLRLAVISHFGFNGQEHKGNGIGFVCLNNLSRLFYFFFVFTRPCRVSTPSRGAMMRIGPEIGVDTTARAGVSRRESGGRCHCLPETRFSFINIRVQYSRGRVLSWARVDLAVCKGGGRSMESNPSMFSASIMRAASEGTAGMELGHRPRTAFYTIERVAHDICGRWEPRPRFRAHNVCTKGSCLVIVRRC